MPFFEHEFQTQSFSGKVKFNTGLFIGGKWVDGAEGKTIECVPRTAVRDLHSHTAASD